jgi:hypothetical protein
MPISIKTPADYNQVYSAILFDDEMPPDEAAYVKSCLGEYFAGSNRRLAAGSLSSYRSLRCTPIAACTLENSSELSANSPKRTLIAPTSSMRLLERYGDGVIDRSEVRFSLTTRPDAG